MSGGNGNVMRDERVYKYFLVGVISRFVGYKET